MTMINDHGGGRGPKYEQSIEYTSQNVLLGISKHFSCNS
jgi:hypothetical protein